MTMATLCKCPFGPRWSRIGEYVYRNLNGNWSLEWKTVDSSARSLPHSDIFQLEWVRANAKLSILVISIADEGISVVD